MGDGNKGGGEDGVNSKGPNDYLQGGVTGIASVWQRNMGGNRCNEGGPGEFLPQDFSTNFRNDGADGQRQGMVVVIGGRGAVGDRALDDEGVNVKATGNHF